MAECLASPLCVKLQMQRSFAGGKPRSSQSKIAQRKHSYGNCKTVPFPMWKTCDFTPPGFSNSKVSPFSGEAGLKCSCLGTLIGSDGATASDWVPIVDQVLLTASVFLTYMAGVIPGYNSSPPFQKNINDNAVPKASNASGSARKNNDPDSGYPINAVKKKLLDSLEALELRDNLGNRVLEPEGYYAKRPLSLNAIADGPRLRLLWTSLQRIEEEVKSISNSQTVNSGYCLADFSGVIQNSCLPVCTSWLETELDLLSSKPNKALVLLMDAKLNGDNAILQNIRNSGKEDLYAELLYFLSFGSLREGCSYDSGLFMIHGVSILEDLVITLADGIISIYLELISVDSNDDGQAELLLVREYIADSDCGERPGKQIFPVGPESRPQFPLEYPTRHKKRQASWGTMELHSINGNSASHDVLQAPSGVQEKANKCHPDILLHEDPRLIYIDDPKRTNDKNEFTGNEIRTSQYTLITFLPKNVFIQFHRVAYLYFLVIAVLNQLPPLAVFGRTASLFPLLFVLCVTAIKDGYEDWRRHRSDNYENNRESLVLQSGQFRVKKWKNIQVGEVLKICADDTIPCDMVMLGTSDPSGIAYIQTMNLDGESNLKTRFARQETSSAVAEGCTIMGIIRCEQPNRNIYEFTANMEFNGHTFPLTQSNIVLRGCQLKNTEWVIGVVVYAGQETKAMLNSAASPPKRSKVERYMNRETLSLSIFLFVMCSVVAAGMGTWLIRHKHQLDTLPYYRKRFFTNWGKLNGKTYRYYGIPMEILFSFLSSVIVFQIMIPISLYITVELVRLGQSYFMIEDRHMFDCNSGARFQCRSFNINEDLGQIRYIFSDKTGTLTENKMEFRRASIHGRDYGSCVLVADQLQEENDTGGGVARKRWKLKSEVAVDSELMELLHKDLSEDERIAAHEFFLTLAACNTVVPIVSTGTSSGCAKGDLDVDSIDYQGESPDEQALVAAASSYRYTLFERTSGHIAIDVNGEKLRLDVLGLHEFDSVRKRMSVVIRFPNNTIKVLVKGADTSMLSILANDSQRDDELRHSTQRHLNEYSSQGLRTLVVAARDLTNEELEQWQGMYEDASTSLSDRSLKLRQTAALIESNLKLLGATAIEDKLQDGVPEAIESLRQAGIKVWVLTGDKQETAISIGVSCKLLTADMQQIIINGTSEAECRNLLVDAMEKYGVQSSNEINQSLRCKSNAASDYLVLPDEVKTSNVPKCHAGKEEGKISAPLALIIDGNSLVYILEKDLQSELFDLATSCSVVVCCRVAPLQKAGIVDLVKTRTDDMTLAIGDGANDVSMIQMADVGVGICGQEGRQAVMASDFAMGQFRFLKRLLLVHGHWNYQRIGYLVIYNFYRNAVFVLMLFWYILSTSFSTTSALTDYSSVFYSLIYTSVPTIVVGVLDKDLSHRTLLQYPKLYGSGHRQEAYNVPLFWITMLDTLWQSLVLFYVPLFTYKESTIDIWSMGSLWTISVVILVNVHLAMDIHRWVFITHLAVWGSIIITYACVVILDSIPVFPNYWTIYHLACSPTYWITILLIIVVALLPRFVYKVVHHIFWASDIQIAREAEMLRRKRKHLGSEKDEDSS